MGSAQKLPQRRSHHSAFIHNDKLFVYGGYDSMEGPLNSLWYLDLNSIQQDVEPAKFQ